MGASRGTRCEAPASAGVAWGDGLGGSRRGDGAPATGACSLITRIRVPPCSISISARLWRVTSSTMCSTLIGARRLSAALPAGVSAGFLHLANGLPGGRDAAEIVPAPRVDLHHVALVEEEGHLDHRAGLEGGGLRSARGGVAADAGIGLHDLQLDEVRQLDAHRAAVDEQDLDLRVLLEEVAGVSDLVRGERDLVVRVQIHEVVALVLVEVLHPLLVEVDQLHLLAGAERVVDHPAEPHVLELGANERAPLARLDVLEVDDAVRLAVELDLEASLELRRRHLHRVITPSVAASSPGASLPAAP